MPAPFNALCILRCLFSRNAREDVKKEELPHLLGLLAQLRPPAQRTRPQCGRGLPVRPAAQLRVPGGRSAQAGHGEERPMNEGSGVGKNSVGSLIGNSSTSANPGHAEFPVQGGHVDPEYTAQVGPIQGPSGPAGLPGQRQL